MSSQNELLKFAYIVAVVGVCGFVAYHVIIFAIFLICSIIDFAMADRRPEVWVRSGATLSYPSYDEANLSFTVWHHFPGPLRNGGVIIEVRSARLHKMNQIQQHSFSEWPPNMDEEVVLDFHFENFDPEEEIEITIVVFSETAKTHYDTGFWKGDNWMPSEAD